MILPLTWSEQLELLRIGSISYIVDVAMCLIHLMISTLPKNDERFV